MRTCAVCRQVRAKRLLTRVVRNTDGSVSIDPTGRAVGRGTYVCEGATCREPRRLAEAVSRALGTPVVPEMLPQEVIDAAT